MRIVVAVLGVVFAAVAVCVVWVLVHGSRVDSARRPAPATAAAPAQP